MLLKRGIEEGTAAVVAELQRVARTVEGDELVKVATIAAKEDEVVGGVVAEALAHVGADGVVTIEESDAPGITVDFVEGMVVENGWLSQYMVRDPHRMETVFENPLVFMTNRALKHPNDLLPDPRRARPQPAAAGDPVRERARRARSACSCPTCATGRSRRRGPRAGLRAPARPASRRPRRVLRRHRDRRGGGADAGRRHARALRHGAARDRHRRRLHVHRGRRDGRGRRGAPGADEGGAGARGPRPRRRDPAGADRAAVGQPGRDHASARRPRSPRRSASGAPRARWRRRRRRMSEGVVPGGGTALLRSAGALDGLSLEGDYARGAEIIRDVLSEPLYWIASNAGYDGQATIDQVRAMPAGHGLNALTGEFGDLFEQGRHRPGARHAAVAGARRVGGGAAADHRGARRRGADRAARRDHRPRASATSPRAWPGRPRRSSSCTVGLWISSTGRPPNSRR